MTDPFSMLMLIHTLGKKYAVWDKTSTIDFIPPSRRTVTARFTLKDDEIAEIKSRTTNGDPYYPEFSVEIVDQWGKRIAAVNKKIYLRKKQK